MWYSSGSAAPARGSSVRYRTTIPQSPMQHVQPVQTQPIYMTMMALNVGGLQPSSRSSAPHPSAKPVVAAEQTGSSPDSAMFTQIAEITDHLYLCGAAALKPHKIRKIGITHIVNATLEVQNVPTKENNIEFTRVALADTPYARLNVHFDKCADKILRTKQRGGKSLVHCVAGISRSTTICLAYLMKHCRMSLRDAYNHVKSRRSIIHPNIGFFKQLMEYERKLFGKSTVKLVATPYGVVPDVYREEMIQLGYL